MPIDLKVLKSRGVSAEAWKAIFTQATNRIPIYNPWNQLDSAMIMAPDYGKSGYKNTPFTGVDHFRERLRLRLMEGRDFNLKNFRTYKALDEALDAPLKRAVTPTLLGRLCDRQGDAESLKKELSAWGFNLDDVICQQSDTKVAGQNTLKISAPAFFQIYVPLVKAYLTIRRAKIMNDLSMRPFFSYEPAWESAKSRLQCDVLTSRVEVMTEQMGYWNTVDEAVFQMLHYGRAWQFPIEEWYSEEQLDAEGKAKTVKSGLRYHLPHPTRVFWDQAHPAHTFNTDTGCEYAGYWRVFRYRDIVHNEGFYNRDHIFIGNYGWYSLNTVFFQSVYPCVMQYPWRDLPQPSNDRETILVDFVYNKDMGDKPIVLTEYFERIVPKQYDLGDYDYPIWARFVVAGDDTVIYAAPVPYAPPIYWHYDEDPARAENPSMSLEILPWQDHLGNLLTQYLLTIKANLANVTFVDEDLVEKRFIDQLKNLGEKLFSRRNFIPFSSMRTRAQMQSIPQAFYSHSFPQLDATGVLGAMKLVLDMVERVLQMSSQEVGAAASHEQTKAEVVSIGQQTSTRLAYTTIPVHQGRHTMMRQIYQAIMAYDDEEFWAEIPADRVVDPKLLEELGFTADEKEHPRRPHDRKMVVRAKKSAIIIEAFAQLREGEERKNQTDIALALLQSLDRLLKGPLGPAIGAEQGITMVNLAGRLAGWPRDFKLRNLTPQQSPEQQSEEIKQQLSGFIKEIHDGIISEVQAGLKPMLEHEKQLAEGLTHVTEIIEAAEAHRPPTQPGMPTPVANGQPVSPFRY